MLYSIEYMCMSLIHISRVNLPLSCDILNRLFNCRHRFGFAALFHNFEGIYHFNMDICIYLDSTVSVSRIFYHRSDCIIVNISWYPTFVYSNIIYFLVLSIYVVSKGSHSPDSARLSLLFQLFVFVSPVGHHGRPRPDLTPYF